MNEVERLVEARQYSEAVQTYRSGEEPLENPARYHYAGALAHHYAGDLYGARYAAERALEKDPDHDLRLLVRFRLGFLAQELGDTHTAVEQFTAILNEKTGDQAVRSVMMGAIWYNLGRARYQRREYQAAVTCYREAVHFYRADNLRQLLCEGLQNLAWTTAMLGNTEEAADVMDEAEAIADDQFLRYKNRLVRAHILRCLGSYHDAVKQAEQLVANGDVPQDLQGLAAWVAGTAAFELGLIDDARKMADIASEWSIPSGDAKLMCLAQELRTMCIQAKDRGA